MKYEKLKLLPEHLFRRNTGVKKKTFARMVEIVQEAEKKRLKGVGRRPKLTLADQLLMMLEYLREYRTYFHLGFAYGVSESNCFKIVRRHENALVKSSVFALPKRSVVLDDSTIHTETIDCTESPVERPQKNSVDTTPERRNGIRSRRR